MRVGRGLIGWATVAASVGLAAPLLASGASPAGAAAPGVLPPGLQPKVVNVTTNPNYSHGEPEIAVNPKNPNNLVYVATAVGTTPNCLANPSNPDYSLCQNVSTSFGPQPAGLVNNVPGFSPNTIDVSFNRGRTWTNIPVPIFTSPFPDAGFLWAGDPGITVTPDGTFYYSEDVIHFQATGFILKDGGVAVSKSTDGGRTWSNPVLSGTAADRPFITSDASTGTVYEESGAGFLGSGSTANPDAPNTGPPGRYLVASTDGVHWTPPAFLGTGIGGPYISAAHGEFATGGEAAGALSSLYCGTASVCVVFQTTTDAGTTWSRHAIPNSTDSSHNGLGDGPLIAADPVIPGHFTVAYLNAANTALYVVQTYDDGNSWSTPTVVTEDPTLTQWKPWMAYSADGTLGLMWRTWTATPNSSPYSVWAAVSFDGGATFTTPLEVSDGNSPAPFNGSTSGDDFSFITLDKQNVYVGWADMRQTDSQGFPERQGFMSKIPLETFLLNEHLSS